MKGETFQIRESSRTCPYTMQATNGCGSDVTCVLRLGGAGFKTQSMRTVMERHCVDAQEVVR